LLLFSVGSIFTDGIEQDRFNQGENLFTPSLDGASIAGAFARENIPWKDIANWTHMLPINDTGRWINVIDGAVRGPNHRWQHHHPIDFFKRMAETRSNRKT